MDIGESNNTFSKKTSKSDTGSTGLFKIGDYDSKSTGNKTGGANTSSGDDGLVEQTIDTVKNQAQALSDAVTGGGNNNNNNKK